MPEPTIDISEIFASIQGEGRYLGQPAIFIRTTGCNLHCTWGDTPCDTAWASWEGQGTARPVAAVLAAVDALREQYPAIPAAVVTGGEPLLQPRLPELLAGLRQRGLFVSLETNGTRAGKLPLDFVSISPKLASSVPADQNFGDEHDRRRIQLKALRQWSIEYPCQFKFVVDRAADEHEIAWLVEVLELPAGDVYLMPQGVRVGQLTEHARLCVDICLRHGWNYTARAQIEIFGNKRGT